MDLETGLTGDELIAIKESIQDNKVDPASDEEWLEDADEYARNTGLTVDSRNSGWPIALDHVATLLALTDNVNPGELVEFPGLPECAFRSIIPLSGEELSTTPQSAAAIDWLDHLVRSWEEEVDVDELTEELLLSSPETSDSGLLKFEEPLLRSNPDADRRALASKLDAFYRTPLSNHRLPLHPVSIDDDEGLEFPAQARRGDKTVVDDLKKGKYEGLVDIKEYCEKANEAPWSDDEQLDLVQSMLTYEGLADQGYVTPPLSPRLGGHMEPPDFFIPDEETCLVPNPSPVSSRLDIDIDTAEKRIFKEDADFCELLIMEEAELIKSCGVESGDLDISGMIKTGEVPLSSQVSSSSPKAEDLKLESPLLPADIAADPKKEPQSFIESEDLKEARELIQSDDPSVMEDKGFSYFLQSKSEKMTRSAEQEKLSSSGGIAPVPVPVMDFSAPKPEWSGYGCDTAVKMFAWIKEHTRDVDWTPLRWPSNRSAEQRMVWVPTPHIRDKKLVIEQIEVDERLLAHFTAMSMDHEVMGSKDFVVKTPGFAILRGFDYDEELLDEDVIFERKTGIPNTEALIDKRVVPRDETRQKYETASLGERNKEGIRKTRDMKSSRKRTREESDQDHSCNKTLPGAEKLDYKHHRTISSRDSQAADLAMVDSAFALRAYVDEKQWDDHSKLVQQYAKRHSTKKTKVNSRFFGSSQQIESDQDEALSPTNQRHEKEEEDARAMPPPPKPIAALAPSFTLPFAPPKIITASSISGLLVMELRKLIPGIGIVTRDYEKRRPRGWYPGLRSPKLDEADITLSPATGVLLTTMVKLRQKSLPGMVGQGQANNAGNFRHVVENVAERYERLVVFISEGNKHSETITPLQGSDANALVEFQGFAAGLSSSCDISVIYLGGGHETLAKWLAATICQYANESEIVQDPLLDEETCWELFLRRAGMNPFGAQAVLGTLKATSEGDQPAIGGNGPLYGLPLFVMMTAEERIIMFEDIFRGRKVLNRVSEVLDAEWARPQVDEPRYFQGHGGVPIPGDPWGPGQFQNRGF